MQLIAAALVQQTLGRPPLSLFSELFSPPPTCSTLKRTNFVGNDIATCGNGTIAATSECCACCAANPECAAFTLSGGTCYLKDRSATASSGGENCTSGRYNSAATNKECGATKGVDFRPDGANASVASLSVASAAECCTACTMAPGCVAWTLYDGTCYMKAENHGTATCSSCVSGIAANRSTPLPTIWKMAGMTFTGGRYCPTTQLGSSASEASLRHLASTGATWVSIVATLYQWNISSTSVFPLYNASEVRDVTSKGYYTFVTESMLAVERTIRHAHALGLHVLLKPHVDLLRDEKPSGRFWRGDIGGCPAADWSPPPAGVSPFTPEEWGAWFKSYTEAFLPYAALAERLGVAMLSMNCELYCANRQAARWRSVVSATREVYRGNLTVSQIVGHEEEMTWWDAVDVIGIDAYYKLKGGSSVAEMTASWRGAPREIALSLHAQYGKPIAYTEVGFCSGTCSRTHTPDANDYYKHAAKYAALLEAYRGDEAWFWGGKRGGETLSFPLASRCVITLTHTALPCSSSFSSHSAFWWNWDADDGSFVADDCLTPQRKPAENVLRQYWRATLPIPPATAVARCIGVGTCTC